MLLAKWAGRNISLFFKTSWKIGYGRIATIKCYIGNRNISIQDENNVDFIVLDAGDDTTKQLAHVEDLVQQEVDVNR